MPCNPMDRMKGEMHGEDDELLWKTEKAEAAKLSLKPTSTALIKT